MKTASLLLAVALLPTAAFAQSKASTPATFQSTSFQPGTLAPAYYTRSVAGGGSITYFGAVSSHNAADAQFAQLRQAFAASQPTLVFYQSASLGIDSTEAATVARFGAAGYTRYLAQQHRVPTARLDNPVAEFAYLLAHVDPTRLKLYMLLRESQRYQARIDMSAALTKRAMRQLITYSPQFLPGTAQVIRTEAEFAEAYRQYCPAGTKWWQAPADWFAPQAAASSPNAFLRELSAAVLAYREQQEYAQVLARAQAGERVLVVMDRADLPAAPPTLAHN